MISRFFAAVVLFSCALPGVCLAGPIEAYPVPTSAEISLGTDSKGAKAPAVPEPAGKTLTVVAPRNGAASGQILLKATGPAAATSVTVSELKGPGGAAIPAGQVQVRYGQYITGEKNLSVYRWQKNIGLSAKAGDEKAASYNLAQGQWRIDCLLPGPQCDVEPNLPRTAWLTFTIARDAAPGLYKGAAAVAGADVAIPIELEVVDAVVPDLAGSAMTNDIRPMWEVIALGNGIPLEDCWKSDAFWKVTAAYLEKLGQLRMSSCGIGVMAPSTTSSLGMVKWTKKGDQWTWDYSAMDKFIEAYRKAVGEPRVLEATAFSHDERKPALSILYTDGETGKQAFLRMDDGPEAADLAVRFVKDLTAHLAAIKLDRQLAVGMWHDKMAHAGGVIRQRLLKDLPDLKVSLWAHQDGWPMPLKDRVAFFMSKCTEVKDYPYPVKIGMRRAYEKSVAFGPYAWDAAVRNHAGLGQVDFANWGEDRRAKEYTYFGAGMFTSWQRQLVYPMRDGQVVTGVLYELFREYSQDFELIKRMQAKAVKTGFLADARKELDTVCGLDRLGRVVMKDGADPAQVDRLHWGILRDAGQAKVRPEGQ